MGLLGIKHGKHQDLDTFSFPCVGIHRLGGRGGKDYYLGCLGPLLVCREEPLGVLQELEYLLRKNQRQGNRGIGEEGDYIGKQKAKGI